MNVDIDSNYLEHIASIICSLFRMLEVSEQGKLWTRVLDKFRGKPLCLLTATNLLRK